MLVPVALLLCFATALIPCHAEEPPYLRTYEDFIEYKTVGPFETTYDGNDWDRWETQWSTDIINNPEYRAAFSELLDGVISDWYERPVTAPGLSEPEPAPVDSVTIYEDQLAKIREFVANEIWDVLVDSVAVVECAWVRAHPDPPPKRIKGYIVPYSVVADTCPTMLYVCDTHYVPVEYDSITQINPVTGEWWAIPDKPQPTHFFVDTTIYKIGCPGEGVGWDSVGDTAIWVFYPAVCDTTYDTTYVWPVTDTSGYINRDVQWMGWHSSRVEP